MNWAVSHEDGEASVTERSIQPPACNLGNILDFTWHPSNSNTLLAMGTSTNNNRLVKHFYLVFAPKNRRKFLKKCRKKNSK